MSAAPWLLMPLKPGGKVPLTQHGFKDASRYRAQILGWRKQFQGSNWGRALGHGDMVLDIDGEQGRVSLAALEKIHGPLPETLTAQTGGGEHRYFTLPDGKTARCSAGKLGTGLDVRSEGGYVVLPPSVHENGQHYAWTVRRKPALCPNWLLELLASAPEVTPTPEFGLIPEGQRHKHLARVAGAMRRQGASPASIEAALLAENTAHCESPKPEAEVRKIARDAAAWLSPEAQGGSIGVLMSEVQRERVRWLWPGRIPLGKITVLDGDPSLGKSTVTLDIAARVSRGLVMPDEETGVLGGVVLAGAEDGLADTVRPRLEAAGADCARILALRPEQFANLTQLETLRTAIARVNAKLVIVDPIMAFLPAEANSWRDQDVRRVLAPLAALADETGTAIVLVRHLRKSADANPLYRGGGSIGIIGAARSGLLAAPDPDDPERRVLALTKSNLAKEVPSLRYRLADSNGSVKIEWLGASNHSAAALLAAPVLDKSYSHVAKAGAWLSARLADGPVESRVVQQASKAAGIAEATLRRAKDRIGVKSGKLGFAGGQWYWSLPEDAQSVEDAQYSEMSAFEQGPINTGELPKMLKPPDIEQLQAAEQDVPFDEIVFEIDYDAPCPSNPKEYWRYWRKKCGKGVASAK